MVIHRDDDDIDDTIMHGDCVDVDEDHCVDGDDGICAHNNPSHCVDDDDDDENNPVFITASMATGRIVWMMITMAMVSMMMVIV